MLGKLFGTKNSIQEQLNQVDLYNVPECDKVQMRLDIFNNYSTFKIAQRMLGVLISLTYVLAIVLALVYQYKGLDYKGVIAIASAFEIGFVMLAMAGFYYSGGAIESFKSKQQSKGN